MNGAAIAQIIGIALALVLAIRAIRTRDLDARRTAWIAAIWMAIIVSLTLLVSLLIHS